MRWGLAFTALVCALSTTLPAGAEEQGSGRSLTDILEEKGVITEEEATEASALEDPKAEPGVRMGYRLGKGFYLESADDLFSLYGGTRTQFRFTYEDRDARSDNIDFRIRRLKLWLEGHALIPELEYKLQVDLGDGDLQLEDIYFTYQPFDLLGGQFGQFKPPQGYQELVSSGRLQLVERSEANDFFNQNRDRGIQLQGGVGDGLFDYSIGIFDGNGANERNVTTDLLYAARVESDPLGPYGEDEADLDHWPNPRVTLGASMAFNPISKKDVSTTTITDSTGAVIDTDVSFELNSKNDLINNFIIQGLGKNGLTRDVDLYLWTVNGGFKYRGFSVSSEGYIGGSNVHGGGAEPWAYGFYFQGGYFFIPKTLEAGAQYSWVDPDQDLAQVRGIRKLQALHAGVSYYILKQALKIQADFGPVQTERFNASTRNDLQFRTQIQLIL
jgi:hypothetical protein